MLAGLVVVVLIVVAATRAFKKADVEQKLEDIKSTSEQFDRIKDVDVEEAVEQKEAVDKFKKL
jgi:hypothetical protein